MDKASAVRVKREGDKQMERMDSRFVNMKGGRATNLPSIKYKENYDAIFRRKASK